MPPKNTQYSATGDAPENFEINTKISVREEIPERNDRYEIELWEEFKKGNESAFILLYKLYFNTLIKYGAQFTRNQDVVKDAIQDLFIDLRKKRSKLSRLRYSLKYYLFKSLKNNILQYLRKRKLIEKYKYSFAADQLSVTESAESHIIQTQEFSALKERLKSAQAQLTSRQREVLFYLYYENLSYAEIQKLMHLKSVKSARNLAYRAVNSLREYMVI